MIIFYTYINTGQYQSLLRKHINALPSDFQQRLAKFRRVKDAQATLLGRLLLKAGLENSYQKSISFRDITYSEHRKPYLTNSTICFNISHSQDIVACVISKNNEIGIDIEYIKPIEIEDFKTQMTTKEWSLVTASENRVLAFYDYWTSKEAILKVTGLGFSLGLKTFEVDESRGFAVVKGQKYCLKECFLDKKYKCYVASKQAFETSPIIHRCDF